MVKMLWGVYTILRHASSESYLGFFEDFPVVNEQLLDLGQENLRCRATASAFVSRPFCGSHFPAWLVETRSLLAWGHREIFFGFSCQNAQSPLEKSLVYSLHYRMAGCQFLSQLADSEMRRLFCDTVFIPNLRVKNVKLCCHLLFS